MRGNSAQWGLAREPTIIWKEEGLTGTQGTVVVKDPRGSFLPAYGSPLSPSAFQERLGIVFWAWAYWEGILGGGKKEKRANVNAGRKAGQPHQTQKGGEFQASCRCGST